MQKVIGATGIIVGTTIGAGMLALPVTLSSFGAMGSIIILTAFWFVMYQAGIIFMDINLRAGQARSISATARKELGTTASLIASICLIGLFYALLSAYIVGYSSVIKHLLTSYANINNLDGKFISLALMLPLVTVIISDVRYIDLTNKFFLVTKILIFIIMVQSLANKIDYSLIEKAAVSSKNLTAIAIVFTSFGFHGSIPIIMNYLDNNREDIKASFFWGTLIPLFIYICWCLTTYGIIPLTGQHSFTTIAKKGGDVGALVTILTFYAKTPWLSTATSIFALFAILTSFIGVGLGLYDFCLESLESRTPGVKRALGAALTTFIPPLIFALFYPAGFILALRYATVALCILAVILPIMIVFKQYLRKEIKLSLFKQILYISIFSLGILVTILDITN